MMNVIFELEVIADSPEAAEKYVKEQMLRGPDWFRLELRRTVDRSEEVQP